MSDSAASFHLFLHGPERAMFSDQIEKMKGLYTDKYVLVDATRPELARFRDVVGRVKTVNMSGRALVEFADYHLNIGWFDIDPEFLKVFDTPPPMPEKAEKAEAKKPTKAAPAAKEKPAAKKAAAPAAKGDRPSVADMLAAARGGGAAKPAGSAPAKSGGATPAKPAAKPAGDAVDRSKMSVADMIAAARAGGAPGATAAAPAAAPAARAEETEAEHTKGKSPAVEAAAKAIAPKSTEKVDKSKMSIADMVAWCREHDTK